MSKVTAIENAIIQLGAGEFQKFCDTFLSKKDQYGAILGLGMKSGTLKTTKGNPDTYFRKENGRYVFAVYTAQQDNIYKKIKEDIDKCLDPGKTQLPIEDIEEIVCCHISSNLSAGEDQRLHQICEKKGIRLTIFGVDEIAQQIYRQYPSLAKDFLGISIDTNQIMSINDFIALYDSNEMAAPLDTPFQGRESELPQVINAIRNNKIVIVHGPAGVGKTRIVLEAISIVAREDGFEMFCVKNNNLGLYDDLMAKIEKPGQYLFFVDDANELSGLTQILQYISKENQGYKVKVILTVRDYVRESVVRTAWNFTEPELISLTPFSDEEIKTFLNINMGITNDLYVNQIIRIAEGNPRIAYMAGKIAKDTRSLKAVHDATQVYEQYYASIIETKMDADKDLCLTAGILAMFSAVMLDNTTCLTEILKLGNLSEDRFRECLYRLASMEVVEVHLNKVASISDQCLANYMLYYEFFEKKVIPFSKILSIGFRFFRKGVIRSINTLLNIFSKESLREYIANEVKAVWDIFQTEKEACFDEFVRVFHIFCPEEAFIIANKKIEKITQEEIENKSIDFEKNIFKTDEEILGLLTGYEYSNHFETAMELLLMYVGKSEEKAVIGYNFLKNYYGIDQDSYRHHFYKELMVENMLARYVGGNQNVQRFILAHIQYALAFEFNLTELGRGNKLQMYHIPLSNSERIRAYRKVCWDSLTELSAVPTLKNDVKEVVSKYAVSIRGAQDGSIVADDKCYVMKIVSIIYSNDIRKAIVVRDLQYGWKRQGISFEEKEEVFETKQWKLYELLGTQRFYTGLSYKEYEIKRKKELCVFADTLREEDIVEFIKMANQIALDSRSKNNNVQYVIEDGVGQILKQLCKDKRKAEKAFIAAMEEASNLSVYPGDMLLALFDIKSAEEIGKLITDYSFDQKNTWKFYYFELIPESMVNENIYRQLLQYLEEKTDEYIVSSHYRNLRFVDKFLCIDENAYVSVSRLIYEKREYSKFIVEIYFTLLFHEHYFSPIELRKLFESDITLLKDIYFFMLKNSDMDDLEGVFLTDFLRINDEWLDAYIDVFIDKLKNDRQHDYEHFNALWKTDDYMRYFDRIFEKITAESDSFSIWKLPYAFETILAHDGEESIVTDRQENWVLHVVRQNALNDKIISLFAAISEMNTSLRKKALHEFLINNDSYEMFKKIPLDPSHWGGSVDAIIPQLQSRIEYLESLLTEMSGVKFLNHAKRVRDRIEMWRSQIEQEELDEICRQLYQ